MVKKHRLIGKISGLNITIENSAFAGGVGLFLIYTFLGKLFFRLPARPSIAGGLFATLLHFISELWHQLGHARAAKHTGYPMQAIHLWGILGTSIYPTDEPVLPPEIHIRRALGGPKASIKAAVAGGLMALIMRPLSGVVYMLSLLFAFENLLIFTIGAFLPLKIIETDGTVLLRQRQQLRRRSIVIQE
jgi:Zn-dependent protease